MPVKDMEMNKVSVSGEPDDLMVTDYLDPTMNSYDEGPGKDLPEQFAKPNKTVRSNCGVFLNTVSPVLEDNGIRHLCNHYGQVKEIKRYQRRDNFENVTVMFATVADAENAIYNINKLRFKVNGKVMKASFAREREKPIEDCPPQFETVEPTNTFYLPLAEPAQLRLIGDFECEREKVLVTTANGNGCTTYSHSPELVAKMQTVGSFDEVTQQFVHNGAADFTTPKQCKNCNNPTIKLCKGCKDPFCSMYCLKQYNRNESGCSCYSSDTSVFNVNRVSRTAAGRGAKLLSSRVISPASRSVCSDTSDTKSIGSICTWKKRLLYREQFEKDQKYDTAIRIEPYDLPKKNGLVTITNVVSHMYVFIRSYEPKDNDQYLKYLNDVVEYAKTAPPLDEMPKKGDIVLAEHEGFYHRAHVARMKNDEAVVAFLELGDVQIKPINGFKKISDQLKNAKQFVFKALLSGMEMSLQNDKCLTYLYDLLEKGTQLKFIAKDADSCSADIRCELVVSATNESVNGKLRTLNNLKPDHPVMLTDILVKPFDATATEVIVIDNSLVAVNGLVTVAIPGHVSDMCSMHKRIQAYCVQDYKKPYTPRLDEICLAKCKDGQWYRVRMEKSYGDMNPVMFFIDFCLYNKVHIDNMRRMPSEFCYPQYSVMAEIGGITEETDTKKLVEKFPLMSKVSVAKIEYLNVDPEELKFFFNTPVLINGDVATSSTVRMPRRQQLDLLLKQLNSEKTATQ